MSLILPPIEQYWTFKTYLKTGNIFLFCYIISLFKLFSLILHSIMSKLFELRLGTCNTFVPTILPLNIAHPTFPLFLLRTEQYNTD